MDQAIHFPDAVFIECVDAQQLDPARGRGHAAADQCQTQQHNSRRGQTRPVAGIVPGGTFKPSGAEE